MKLKGLLFLCLCVSSFVASAQSDKVYTIKSPDGNLNINLSAGAKLTWWANSQQKPVVLPSVIGLVLSNGDTLGNNAVVASTKAITVNDVVNTPLYKKAKIIDNYNQLTVNFKDGDGVILRAYNDGVAYRFFTDRKGDVTIRNEVANFNLKEGAQAWLPFVHDYRNHDKFNTSFEALYNKLKISAIKKDTMAFLPVLIDLGHPLKTAILEADLQDYPGMYLKPDSTGRSLHGVFAPYPVKESLSNINYVVNQRTDYIAKTVGKRTFPWRVLVVSTNDKELANSDMVQKLSEPSRIADISWIKPGKVAWDWWNDWNITHVDFKAGINVPTYKYYIDFAAANKLEYIIMDEGWSDDNDLNKLKIDVQQIVDYGKKKNVGVILWSTWYGMTRNADAIMSKYSKMGVKGFKIDFIDRDDQKMVSSLYQLAEKAAQYHLMVDYHGMYKPSGMQRTLPNIINCEGVYGMENLKWGALDEVSYDVCIPFIRMLAGPMDYTPGAMRNATKSSYRPIDTNPMSQGTRCHQLAMYAIYEAPLQMLADNPDAYKREQECTDFIAAVPTTFDETAVIDGRVGEHVAIARRKGTTWYAGAMTNWDERDIALDLSFLGSGRYRVIVFADGINADHNATDYTKQVIMVNAGDKIAVHMAPGGGWAARFEKAD